MKKKIIGMILAFLAGATLLIVGIGGFATGLTPFSLNTITRGVATSSNNNNIGAVPANCELIGPLNEIECHDDLTGSASFSLPQ